MVQYNLLSGLDVRNAVLMCKDGFLKDMVLEALDLAAFEPGIKERLAADIDHAARSAKKVRLMDEIYQDSLTDLLPGIPGDVVPSDFDSVCPDTLSLNDGRPRGVDGILLLLLEVINSPFPLTRAKEYALVSVSDVFIAVLSAKGLTMPKRPTVAKYLALVSDETRRFIHEATLRKAKSEGLDDFERLTVDSTAVWANSAWPSESGLVFGFLNRADRLLKQLGEIVAMSWESALIDRWLAELESTHKVISLLPSRPGSRKERCQLYRALLAVADKVADRLQKGFDTREHQIETCALKPSVRLHVDALVSGFRSSLEDARQTACNAHARVVLNQEVPADSKVYSLCDSGAYMIVKGDREPVLGYKPQIGRSANGFVTCFEIQTGNPADSTRLQAMVDACIRNTGVRLVKVSTDDGYSAQDNLDKLRKAGVKYVSFSGAKGRRVLGDDVYKSQEYKDLRDDRSTVESTVFVLKQKFSLARFSRRGLSGVQAELADTAIAYNIWRLSYLRRARKAEPVAVVAA